MYSVRAFWGALVLSLSCPLVSAGPPEIGWTMLNVSPRNEQADCHLLRMPDGSTVLIDVADAGDAPGEAMRQLSARHLKHVDLLILSHFHRDHYGRLRDLLSAGITVGRVALNVPTLAAAMPERPWGCDLHDVFDLLVELDRRGIPYFTPNAGEQLFSWRGPDAITAAIDVICCYDGSNTPVGVCDVNDTSIILRVSIGQTRVLFTGDLNTRLGTYLAESTVDLRADILKAPHHGTEGTAPNIFYDRVGARLVLVPSPRGLWESARSMRVRNYFLERNIPALVSGIDGNVTVHLRADGYTVEKER